MIVNSFQIDAALQLTDLPTNEVPEALKSPDARIWVDLHDFQGEELNDWLNRLDVKGLSRQLCLEARDRAGFYPLNNESLVVVPFLSANTSDKRTVEYIALLCRENLLLTIHQTSILTPQRRAEILESHDWLTGRSIAALVAAIMNDLSQDCLEGAAQSRRSILALEDCMDRDPNAVEAEEILDRRSELIVLGRIVSDQLPPLQLLSTTEKSFFKLTDARDFLNCALANLHSAERSLEWLDRRVGDLRSGFQMNAQDKTNRRLNLLTILTAIFTPITALAGIWGMNFETMPELKLPFAYPIAIGLMVLIGVGMYQYFHRQGWFD